MHLPIAPRPVPPGTRTPSRPRVASRRRPPVFEPLEARCLLALNPNLVGQDQYVRAGRDSFVQVAYDANYAYYGNDRYRLTEVVTDWGDGSSSSASFDGGFGLGSNHTYAQVGDYGATVDATFERTDGSKFQLQEAGTVHVLSQIFFTPSQGPLYFQTGASTANATPVGIVTDIDSPATQLHATIDWGDGTGPGPATLATNIGYGITTTFGLPYVVTYNGSVGLGVESDHHYASPGNYVAHVTIDGPGGTHADVDVPVTVASGSIYAHPAPDSDGFAGVPTVATVGNVELFGDTNGFDPTRVTTTVDWGDGTPVGNGGTYPEGTEIYGSPFPSGHLHEILTGSHTYAAPGDYAVTLFAVHDDGSKSQATETLHIKAQSLSLSAPPLTATRDFNQVFTVATGTALSVKDSGDSLAATIDWGDGSAPTSLQQGVTDGIGLVHATSDGKVGFSVYAPHQYDHAGTYTVSVSLTSITGAHATSQGTVTVRPFAAIAAPDPILDDYAPGLATPPPGTIATAGAYAGFPDRGATASDFRGTIDWGDGTPVEPASISLTTIADASWTGAPGSRAVALVSGAHDYLNPGTYKVNIAITGPDGTPVTISSLKVIQAPPPVANTPGPAPTPTPTPTPTPVPPPTPSPAGHYVLVYAYGHPDSVRKVWVADSIKQAHPKPSHVSHGHPRRTRGTRPGEAGA